MTNSYVCVPIRTTQFLSLIQFLQEQGSDRDPEDAVSAAIEYWVDNASWKQEVLLPEVFEAPAEEDRGYDWKGLFLSHGTMIRMKYRREYHYAKVEGDQILYKGEPVSASEFASTVAGHSRNAWRDLWIKCPEHEDWYLADDLRTGKSPPIKVRKLSGKNRQFRDDLIEAISALGEVAHRKEVIGKVYNIRKRRGDTLPSAFDETVQHTFERHCGESEIFCGDPDLDLFRWPEGKGTGVWGLNIDKVAGYCLKVLDLELTL